MPLAESSACLLHPSSIPNALLARSSSYDASQTLFSPIVSRKSQCNPHHLTLPPTPLPQPTTLPPTGNPFIIPFLPNVKQRAFSQRAARSFSCFSLLLALRRVHTFVFSFSLVFGPLILDGLGEICSTQISPLFLYATVRTSPYMQQYVRLMLSREFCTFGIVAHILLRFELLLVRMSRLILK
jgi:hypothetical protein